MRFKEEGTENDVNAGEAGDDDDDQEVSRVLSVRFTTGSSPPASPSEDLSFNDTFRNKVGCGYSVYRKSSGISLTFSGLVVLKLLLFDLAVSLGDAVTDILQGVYLICWYNERGEWRLKEDTWHYGLWVLIVCWVPGLVCVIHILSHHSSYQPQSESESSLNICVQL